MKRRTTNKQPKLLFRLIQKVKRDELAALNRNLHVTDNLDLISLDGLNYTKNVKKSITTLVLQW